MPCIGLGAAAVASRVSTDDAGIKIGSGRRVDSETVLILVGKGLLLGWVRVQRSGARILVRSGAGQKTVWLIRERWQEVIQPLTHFVVVVGSNN